MDSIGAPAEPRVYIGSWTNWSHGKVLGATLTLTRVNGDFLIAFLALFVSFVGTSFFRLSCFALHHILSSSGPQDDVHHQRQAILRNTASGTNAIFSLSEVLWSHIGQGGRDKKLFKRLFPLLLHTAIMIAAFAVAGVYSSRISALTGGEVLVWSPLDDAQVEKLPINLTDPMDPTMMAYTAARFNTFSNYAQACYSDSQSTTAGCNTYVKPKLAPIIEKNAECPFDAGLCRTQTGNIRIDSGYLDSHFDLGINFPVSKRFRYRQVLQCAPINTKGYVMNETITSNNKSDLYHTYYYGNITDVLSETVQNYTHAQPDQAFTTRLDRAGKFDTRYTLGYV